MARLLQLVESDGEDESRCMAQLLRTSAGAEFSIEQRELRDNAANAVSHLLNMRRSDARYDLVHAFGMRALGVASLLGGRIVFSPARYPTHGQIRWLRAVMAYRDVQVVCPTDTLRRTLVERGVPLERCHLIRPAVQFARINRRRSDELRASLGFGPDDHVILACGESTHAANHSLALWTASILHVLDPKFRLLLWGRGENVQTILNVNAKGLQPRVMRSAENQLCRRISFEELLPAADSLLITARAPVNTLPICIGMAAALPIVSTVTTTVCELLEDRHTAVFLPSQKPRIIAQKILDLLADPSLQWRISDMARTEAYEYFSQTRFLSQYRALFQQFLAGQVVELLQPVAGAGSRFHGLA